MTRRLPTAAFALAALAVPPAAPAAAEQRPSPPLRRLTDNDLLRHAAAPFDKRAMMFKRVVLGRHRGHAVVAIHPCGDVCPQYTRRIVHYDLAPERCAAAGGVVVEELVPVAIAVRRQPYCKPAVLARAAGAAGR
ncbi:MAG TPA: hypothetical protein VF605_16125 [Allosphingosinicella sp.]|jgi:hypothetical protein